mgnify:CR=1 FL=1
MQLFIYETCPFCVKVRDAMKQIGYKEGEDIILVDAHQEDNKERLLKLGGKSQVPFLVDGDTLMYESDEIISYLVKKKAKQFS